MSFDALNRPRLGRIPSFDERSRQYPIRTLLAARPPRRRVLWKRGEQLDQGTEGACVGFSWLQDALASPVRVRLPLSSFKGVSADTLARVVYHRAQTLDEWPGESYDGTSVIAGAKAMVGLGFYREYRWAFGADDLRDSILTHGPAVLGINWYEGMWNPSLANVISPTGNVVGGHAILCNGYDPGQFHLQNSWGSGWGVDGGAWVSFDDMARLLSEDGEACVPVGRSYNR